ncbi:choice-of-anchor I family protein [Wenyingzhuangia sp. IMCC45574]
MKKLLKLFAFGLLGVFTLISCGEDGLDGEDGTHGTDGIDGVDGTNGVDGVNAQNNYFSSVSSIEFGEGIAEISAFDINTNTLFSTNPDKKRIEVIDVKDITAPTIGTPIDITTFGGNVNSVACKGGFLAIAIENDIKTDNGKIIIFNTSDLSTPYAEIEAGALPDMVTFTPDGKYILAANEGEPNDDYTVDPEGTITMIEVATKTSSQINFHAFNPDKATLEASGFRVFGPGANLSRDIEPEYITTSSDSKFAFISLQENNGMAKLDIASKTITNIYPFGTKDYNDYYFDFSDKDGQVGKFSHAPVLSFYQPDAIDYFEIDGNGYIITANEGDAREYNGSPGFVEESRLSDIDINTDSPIFDVDELDIAPADRAAFIDKIQKNENLGRLKITLVNGKRGSGYDRIYSYGARSFSIWNTNGKQIYDSGNELALLSLNQFGSYPDNRSADKGTEPEAVTTFKDGDTTFAVIGLERSGDVLVYNISNVNAPIFLQRLKNTSPEGLLIVDAANSPNGKTLLIVSNEKGAKHINIYSN